MDKATTVWANLQRRIITEKWLILATALVAGLVVYWGLNPAAVFFSWLVLLAGILNRAGTPAAPVPPPAVQPVSNTMDDRLHSMAPVMDALDLPILLVGEDETVLYQNHAAEKAFGTIPKDTYLSARVRSPGILDMVRETMATGRPNQIEHSERLPSEAVYLVRVAPADLRDPRAGKLFVLSYRDISQLRRLDRMRSDFVANASHELRTPLASLRGFIETLQGPARNDQKAHETFLAIMLEQATRMSRLVDDLLSLSRLELKSHLAPDEAVDLSPLLGHVRDALAPLARELEVDIELDLPDGPVFVQGDRDELIEVFENLIENACKYGQEGKSVLVRLTQSETGSIEVLVRDFGPGIPAEHVPRITERFYRVNIETSRSKKGTGLGLAIVKHILTRHRARLVIHSEVGKGTDFTVRF